MAEMVCAMLLCLSLMGNVALYVLLKAKTADYEERGQLLAARWAHIGNQRVAIERLSDDLESLKAGIRYG